MSITISDIAKRANVSQATVSRVLNNSGYVKQETKEKIEAVIKELNYTPSAIARSLSKKETNTIGVIVPDITNPYFGELIKGISNIAEKNNLNIIFYNTDNCFEKELRALNTLKEQRIKGIIMTPGFGADKFYEQYKDILNNLNCPIVLACADLISTKLNGVFVDNFDGAFKAANLLAKEGHEKIGIMLGSLSSEPMIQRLDGYKKALKLNKLEINQKYIFRGDFSLKRAYELTKDMIKRGDYPSGMIISTNRMTIGVIKALEEENKKIPNDIALIGADKNELLDMFGVNITYIEECPIELGEKSMEMLCTIMKHNNIHEVNRTVIIPKIILKGSEKKPVF